MKSYYELSKEDMQKYIKEFNQTTFAKGWNNYRLVLLLFIVFIPCLGAFLEEVASLEVQSLIEVAWGLVGIIYIILSVVLNYARMRYLKIKHKIEY